jgi:hypothetical protein
MSQVLVGRMTAPHLDPGTPENIVAPPPRLDPLSETGADASNTRIFLGADRAGLLGAQITSGVLAHHDLSGRDQRTSAAT